MTFHYRYRKQIILGMILLLIIVGGTTLIIIKMPKKKETKKESIVLVKKKEEKAKEEILEKYKVDIKGEINSPGLYEIEIGKRVMDAIILAGGLTERADTSVINLSKKITDEMVIIIYSKEEVNHFKETKELEKVVQEKCIEKEENSIKNDACITTDKNSSGKISINTGTIEELKTLSGIGEAKAKEIISYRETNGPFETIEDIMKVPGIGEAKFAAIKEDITIE